MKYFKNQKAVLFTVEGFDRTGKRTLLKNLKVKFKNDDSIYIYETPDDPNKPDFRDSKNYQKWLSTRTKIQMDDIMKLADEYDVVIKKDLLLSDICFSQQFNRVQTVQPYMDALRSKYTIVNLVMLYSTYTDYVNRIQKIGEIIKYNILDYKLLHTQFKAISKKCFKLYNDLYHIHAQRYFHSPSTIANEFSTYISSMKNVLFNRLIN